MNRLRTLSIFAVPLLLLVGVFALQQPDNLALPSITESDRGAEQGDKPAIAEHGTDHESGLSNSVAGGVAKTPTETTIQGTELEDIHARIADNQGVDEADFMLSLTSAFSDWDQVKSMIEEREAQTGQDYGELLMKIGLGNGQITGEEIVELVNRGVPLQEDTFGWLSFKGNAGTFAHLAKSGLLIDVNQTNSVTGKNAIGSYIDHVGHFPTNYSSAEVVDAVQQLVEVGVDPVAGLSSAFSSVNPSNFQLKLDMARGLIQQGASLTSEHRQLVNAMRERPYKTSFLKLFE